MKPVFKCDYCSKMGTEEEIKEHESNCSNNYDRKSCETCIHKKFDMKCKWYTCDIGKEIPEGKVYVFCDTYERKEKTNINNEFADLLFGNWFGK